MAMAALKDLRNGVKARIPALMSVFLAVCLFDSFASERPSSKGAQTGGAISGIVTDLVRQAPIPNAVVWLREVGTFTSTSAIADADGAYSFSDVAPGEYWMLAEADGYATLIHENKECGYYCDITVGDVVVVTDESAYSIDFGLRRLGKIAGVVRDVDTGEPIESAVVVLKYQYFTTFDANTDSAGRFAFENLAAGAYYATISSSGYVSELYDDIERLPGRSQPVEAFGTPIVVAIGESTNIQVDLKLGGSVSGAVNSSPPGLAVSAEVAAYDASGTLRGQAQTDGEGNFHVAGLPSGDYFVTVTARDFVNELYDDIFCRPDCPVFDGARVSVSSGENTSGVDFELERSGSIAGRIRDGAAGTFLDAEVEAYDLFGNLIGSDKASGGNYVIEELPEGQFQIYVESRTHVDQLFPNVPCFQKRCVFGAGEAVSVDYGQVTSGIDILMNSGGVLEADTVVDSQSGLPIEGYFTVWDAQGERVTFSGRSEEPISFTGLPPGDYHLGARSPAHVGEVFDNLSCTDLRCSPTDGTPIPVVTDESTGPIQFELETGGSITGTVIAPNPDELPLYGRVRYRNAQGTYLGETGIGPDGRYIITGLAAGNYYVHASTDIHFGKVYPDTPYSDFCSDCAGPPFDAPVAVVLNETTSDVDFELEIGGQISGRVVDSEGNPIESATLIPYDEDGHVLNINYRRTDENGEYLIPGILPGEHHLRARPREETGLDPQLYGGVPCPFPCEPFAGETIEVSANQVTAAINFVLMPTEIIAKEDNEWP